MIYLDRETVGLTGPGVLLQWAEDDGPVHLHHVFARPAGETVQLIERLMRHEICAFNLTFDAFHTIRDWATLRLLDPSAVPTPQAYFSVWRQASELGMIVKPASCLDLFLYARSGPMQALMERDDVRIRRVPVQLAAALCEELTSRLDLPKIFFARNKVGARWQVQDDPDDPDFPDVYLAFGAKGGLKPLAGHLLGVDTIDLPLHESLKPPAEKDNQWNPWFTEGMVDLVHRNVLHWKNDKLSLQYAVQDIDLLRQLRQHWGNPPAGDDNSVLAWCVAACRFHGYKLDRLGVHERFEQSQKLMFIAPRAAERVKAELLPLCSEAERLVVEDTTAETLDAISKWTLNGGPHPAAEFCKKVATARSAEKRCDHLLKLGVTRRFHPDFKVVGTLSNRMAGAGGLPAHGIEAEFLIDGQKHSIRKLFIMADEGEELEGGDFDAFEVTIAAAVYNDPKLTADLQSGKKIHALFGAAMYGKTYDEVKLSAAEGGIRFPGMGWDGNLYDPAKGAVFSWIYGAQTQKMSEVLRLPEEETERGVQRFFEQYPVLAKGRQADADDFCSMIQPGGIGTNIIWREPKEYAESLLGFKRYFTLENKLCYSLFELAKKPPGALRGLKGIKVKRRDRQQTLGGAVQSALYAAAFQMQARAMRAAGNHRIQSTGASITKRMQRKIWDLQPIGVAQLNYAPMNMHDELVTPTIQDLSPIVYGVVEEYKKVVPLLGMKWKRRLPSWGAIKG